MYILIYASCPFWRAGDGKHGAVSRQGATCLRRRQRRRGHGCRQRASARRPVRLQRRPADVRRCVQCRRRCCGHRRRGRGVATGRQRRATHVECRRRWSRHRRRRRHRRATHVHVPALPVVAVTLRLHPSSTSLCQPRHSSFLLAYPFLLLSHRIPLCRLTALVRHPWLSYRGPI